MPDLTIRAFPGYDHRDTGGAARGLHLTFTVEGRTPTGGRYASTLEVQTGWNSQPLARGVVFGFGPQPRRPAPGTDGEARRDPTPTVVVCVPAGDRAPGYFRGNGLNCPYLGVPCLSDIGYTAGDPVLAALIDGSEADCVAQLHALALHWLEAEPTPSGGES